MIIPNRCSSRVRFARVLVQACLLFLLASNVNLQGAERQKPPDNAVIFGTVWGPDDRPVYGIQVKMRRAEEKKARWQEYCNRRGEFEFQVPAGRHDYVIWADTKSYKLQNGKHFEVSPEVTVHTENNERVDTGVHLK